MPFCSFVWFGRPDLRRTDRFCHAVEYRDALAAASGRERF